MYSIFVFPLCDYVSDDLWLQVSSRHPLPLGQTHTAGSQTANFSHCPVSSKTTLPWTLAASTGGNNKLMGKLVRLFGKTGPARRFHPPLG